MFGHAIAEIGNKRQIKYFDKPRRKRFDSYDEANCEI